MAKVKKVKSKKVIKKGAKQPALGVKRGKDARLKIIANSRSKMVDARDKLVSLNHKAGVDARSKIQKIRNLKKGMVRA